MSLRTRTWRTLCLAAAVVCSAAGARADIVAVAGKPLAVAVDILSLRDGELHYRMFSGDVVTDPIQDVVYLQRIQWKAFNWAEKLYRDGKYAQAVDAYQEALKAVENEPPEKPAGGDGGRADGDHLDRRLLVQCRLLQALNAESRFVEALEFYLTVIERMPACLATLRPKDPPRGAPAIEQAVRLLDPAIHRHRADAIGTSLKAWRATWAADVPLTFPKVQEPPATETDRKPEPPPVATNPAPDTQPAQAAKDHPPSIAQSEPKVEQGIKHETPPPNTRPAGDVAQATSTKAEETQIATPADVPSAAGDHRDIADKIKQGRFDEALGAVEDRLAEADLVERVGLYYWRGVALTERARTRQGVEAEEDRRSAGLAFMRVVIHAPRADLAPECLYRAGQLCRDAEQPDQARALWAELIETYPDAQPWVDRARQNLETSAAATP